MDVTADMPPIGESIGTRIGRYKLLQEVGEGGFGVVFMAEQTEPVRRKVALKIIKPGMDTREVVARFEAERQALALMDHPNIARVLDAGSTESGRPYFVMELVKGIPVTDYCDTNNLSTRERLELFTQICRAVQHAHQKGVIHRDLKPSNVMVTLHDGKPVPKVIDFGVSKALNQQLTEKTLFTHYGQIVGTPQYMSPEQAEMSGLDVDTRSDIYSLGVLLYELLTGKPPFDGETLRNAGFDEMRRVIREQEPPKPSTKLRTLDKETATAVAAHRSEKPQALHKLVLGDLDWIVMKALEKDRNRRYETANGFARDIERHLNDETVAAGRPSLVHKITKIYRRNRTLVTSALLTFAAMLVALVLTTAFWLRALRAEQIAVESRLRAEESEAKARRGETAARESAQLATEQAEATNQTLEILQTVVFGLVPTSNSGPNYTVRQLIDDFAERLNSEDPAPEVECRIRMFLAEAYRRNGRHVNAIPQLNRMLEICEGVYGPDSLVEAQCRAYLANSSSNVGKGSEALYLNALQALERSKETDRNVRYRTINNIVSGLKDLDVAERLTRESIEIAMALPECSENPYTKLARIHEKRRDFDQAEKARSDAIEFARRKMAAARVATSFWRRGQYRTRTGNLNEAAEDLMHAHNTLEGEGHQILAGTLVSLVSNRRASGDRKAFAVSAAFAADSLKRNWEFIHHKFDHQLGIAWLTNSLFDTGQAESADQVLSHFQRYARAFGDEMPSNLRLSIADALLDAGRFSEAKNWYTSTDSMAHDQTESERAAELFGQAKTYSKFGSHSRARPLIRKAIEIQQRGVDQWHSEAWYRFALAINDCESADAISTGEFRKAAMKLAEQASSPSLGPQARAAYVIACCYGDNSVPIHALEKEARLALDDAASDHYAARLAQFALGLVYEKTEDEQKSVGHLLRAATAEPQRPLFYAWFSPHRWIQGECVRKLRTFGNGDRAVELLRRLVQQSDEFDHNLGTQHPDGAFTRIKLAELLAENPENHAEAKTLLLQAQETLERHRQFVPDTTFAAIQEQLDFVSNDHSLIE